MIDKETGKLYYFNKYWNSHIQTLEWGSRNWKEQRTSSHHLLDAKLQEPGDLKVLPASAFLSEMLTSSWAPWLGVKYHAWQKEVLRHTYSPYILGGPGWSLPVLTATQIHCLCPPALQCKTKGTSWVFTPISCMGAGNVSLFFLHFSPLVSCYTKFLS
jgi:hypothetical protein